MVRPRASTTPPTVHNIGDALGSTVLALCSTPDGSTAVRAWHQANQPNSERAVETELLRSRTKLALIHNPQALSHLTTLLN